jgi:hypothetical protein
VDVLVHVPIKYLKGRGVWNIPSSSWDFAVLNSSEFVVLLPQVGLKDFGRSQEPENCRISVVQASWSYIFGKRGKLVSEQLWTDSGGSRCEHTLFQERTPVGPAIEHITNPYHVFSPFFSHSLNRITRSRLQTLSEKPVSLSVVLVAILILRSMKSAYDSKRDISPGANSCEHSLMVSRGPTSTDTFVGQCKTGGSAKTQGKDSRS